MPYIAPKDREYWNEKMKSFLEGVNSDTPKGHLNYMICMLYIKAVGTKKNYNHMSECRAALIDAWDEIGDMVMRPYEDVKRKQSGDLPWPKVEG